MNISPTGCLLALYRFNSPLSYRPWEITVLLFRWEAIFYIPTCINYRTFESITFHFWRWNQSMDEAKVGSTGGAAKQWTYLDKPSVHVYCIRTLDARLRITCTSFSIVKLDLGKIHLSFSECDARVPKIGSIPTIRTAPLSPFAAVSCFERLLQLHCAGLRISFVEAAALGIVRSTDTGKVSFLSFPFWRWYNEYIMTLFKLVWNIFKDFN